MPGDVLQTEFEFTLPLGYVDEDGNVHRSGVMRLARAADEIAPRRDPRVTANPAYLSILILSRVITALGDLPGVSPAVVEDMTVADVAYLQDLYDRVNGRTSDTQPVVCPACGESFDSESP